MTSKTGTLYALGYRTNNAPLDEKWLNRHGDQTPAPEYVFSLEDASKIAGQVGRLPEVIGFVMRAKEPRR